MSNAYRSTLAGGGAAVGDATAADVLSGKTFSGAVGSGVTGTMPNRGAVSGTANPSQPYTIPAGYHNGSGIVTAEAAAPTGITVENIAAATPKTYSNKKGALLLVELSRNDTAWTGDNQYTVTGMSLIQRIQNTTTSIPVALGGGSIHVQRCLYQITADSATFTTPTYGTCNTLIE